MNSAQIHLALTHFPLILSMAGLVVLIVAIITKNDTLTKTSFYFILFAGVTAIPVFFTGEGAEETVEHIPAVSESVVERHEELAKFAFGVVSASAVISLVGLIFFNKNTTMRLIRFVVLFMTLVTVGTMALTAHLGGQVRHTELRSNTSIQLEGSEQQNPDRRK